MTNLTKLTIFTAALMAIAAAAVLFSGSGPFSTADEDSRATREAPAESATDGLIADLQARSAARPDDAGILAELGFAYLQKARENGDPSLYSQADATFQKALTLAPEDPGVITGLGAVALARHDFEAALDYGRSALALDPSDADAHAVAGDALIELGRYDEGVAEFQAAADARPDLNAYVRIAYARELHGDIAGAREALAQAIEAGGPRGENAAYARLQLGHLLAGTGELGAARAQYEHALDAFPGYVHALAGLARVHAGRGDYRQAARLYEDLAAGRPSLEYVIALGDVYLAAGDQRAADAQYSRVDEIDKIFRENGFNTDEVIATFLADRGVRLDEAVSRARSLYEVQPRNPHAAETLAWALHRAGRQDEAAGYITQALSMPAPDAELMFRAGMIENALGNRDEARGYLEQALSTNPYFSPLYAKEARMVLAELESFAEAR